MFSILLGIQVVISVGIITLVMLQQGKGADMGAGFGAGASGTVFGSRGSGSFFTRATAILATVFFINCLLIASPLVRDTGNGETLADKLQQQSEQQREAAVAEELADTLEQQNAAPAIESDIAAPAMDDVPSVDDLPAVPAASPADDLPE